MAMKSKLRGAHFAPLQTQVLQSPGVSGLVATGTTATDALAISSELNVFATVASGTGALLTSAMEVGDSIEVYNGGANTLILYPETGLTINGGASFNIAAAKLCYVRKVTSTNYGAFVTA